MSMKQIEAQIMGQTYVLGCPEGAEEQMQQSVQRVDTAMCKIRDAGKIRARDRIAVLAALNLAFDLVEREQAGGFNAQQPPHHGQQILLMAQSCCTRACNHCCIAWKTCWRKTANCSERFFGSQVGAKP